MTMTLAVRSNPGEQAERQEDIRGQGEDLPRGERKQRTNRHHTHERSTG